MSLINYIVTNTVYIADTGYTKHKHKGIRNVGRYTEAN